MENGDNLSSTEEQIHEKQEWEELEFSLIQKNTPIEPIFLKLIHYYRQIVSSMDLLGMFFDHDQAGGDIANDMIYGADLSDEDRKLSIPDLINKYLDANLSSIPLDKVIPLQRLRPIKQFFYSFLGTN